MPMSQAAIEGIKRFGLPWRGKISIAGAGTALGKLRDKENGIEGQADADEITRLMRFMANGFRLFIQNQAPEDQRVDESDAVEFLREEDAHEGIEREGLEAWLEELDCNCNILLDMADYWRQLVQ